MFKRIVKMSFDPTKVDEFLKNFEIHKNQIRNFEGCHLLELLQDKNNPSILFSYSYWESENHLENYRNSALFKSVWSKTKILFNNKPEAWSVDTLESLL